MNNQNWRLIMYDYAKFMAELERKNPAQPEFIQAAGEIIASVIDCE